MLSKLWIKETVSFISSGPSCKYGHAWFKTDPLNLNLIKNVEDSVVLLIRKLSNSDNFSNASYEQKIASHFCRITANENEEYK